MGSSDSLKKLKILVATLGALFSAAALLTLAGDGAPPTKATRLLTALPCTFESNVESNESNSVACVLPGAIDMHIHELCDILIVN